MIQRDHTTIEQSVWSEMRSHQDLRCLTLQQAIHVADMCCTLIRWREQEIEQSLTPPTPFQRRVDHWMQQCFGPAISSDRQERSHRFLEEALELVQAAGCTRSEAMQLVEYVYGRATGELRQEIGGVAVTLHALCTAHGIDLDYCAETELQRVHGLVDKIREKQRAKPRFSPLPEIVAADHYGKPVLALTEEQSAAESVVLDDFRSCTRTPGCCFLHGHDGECDTTDIPF